MVDEAVSDIAPVTVAGGGVVGLTLALMLARRGVHTVVLERDLVPLPLPRAHAVNPRTLEILREIDILPQDVAAVAAPRELTAEVRFVTTMTGHCFGVLPYERQDPDVLALTPTPLLNVPQPELERLLLARVQADDRVDLRRGHTWVSAVQRDGEVTSTVRAGEEAYELTSEYLVAADGAGSQVRESLGISMTGVEEVAAAVTMTFKADLTPIVASRPGVLHWVFEPQPHGTFISYQPDSLWAYIITMPPGHVDMTQYTRERALDHIRAGLGPGATDVAIELVAVIPWTMRAQVADRYRQSRVLLAGDAAHRFPPTGGLGLNTGLQDAHNLSWKLAAVIAGWSPEPVLDTYETERRRIAVQNADQSLQNARALAVLSIIDEACGLGSGTDAFKNWLADGANASAVAQAIAEQRGHFDSLALQLGFSYDPDDEPPADVSTYVPSARAGRRLPHGWLNWGDERVSTLDVLDPEAFTVLWLADDPSPIDAGPVPVTVVHLSPGRPDVQGWVRAAGLTKVDAVLVRPDGHILETFPSGFDTGQLVAVIRDLLNGGRPLASTQS
ncbi:FAD-dependent monooxygenase [Angustibacter luteus]|uniref:FAD-dependent monooxygenase n=1 Tax=Angustibacter luteus TaxID=658456 RepID=A0ABW1JDQ7_9ACTN